jgi:hypothetical protein
MHHSRREYRLAGSHRSTAFSTYPPAWRRLHGRTLCTEISFQEADPGTLVIFTVTDPVATSDLAFPTHHGSMSAAPSTRLVIGTTITEASTQDNDQRESLRSCVVAAPTQPDRCPTASDPAAGTGSAEAEPAAEPGAHVHRQPRRGPGWRAAEARRCSRRHHHRYRRHPRDHWGGGPLVLIEGVQPMALVRPEGPALARAAGPA